MSFDYFFFARHEGQVALQDLVRGTQPIGTPQAVMQAIGQRFPSLSWQVPIEGSTAWFGLGGGEAPEFMVAPQDAGAVLCFKASRIELDEAVRLAEAMNLTVLDPQRGDVF